MLRLTCLRLRVKPGCARNLADEGVRMKARKPETHYQVLNVKSDCSTQDIRNAFVELSKQYHPDVKTNAASSERTARFVRISEAYRTLIKPQTRRDYDDSLLWLPTGSARSPVGEHSEASQSWNVKPNYAPSPGPYYGIRGLKRVSNWQVALVLIAFGVVGAFFGFTSVKHSFDLHRQVQDEVSAEATNHHAAVVAEAQKHGNEEQMRRLADRLARNPYNQSAK
ncbi:dnaJ-like protein 60 isoform X1 [Drosophila subobscura]|uniref:dnaJ-like protein 60 isoform X1 n=2 Tax=Drosophila subobscura TaxID=7241 RepID=UPI00155A8022|nr:dnaJ-like protein 60 isoform X1 [Drosophila subobscura]